MTRLYSLAAIGALIFSATSSAAETFDVREHLLHRQFGDSISYHIARRQELSSTEPLDALTSADTTYASASPTATTASDLWGELDSKTFSTSRTRSSLFASSTASPTDGYYGYWSGPDASYIVDMCMPNLYDESRARNLGIKLQVTSMKEGYLEAAKLAISLGGSPFPCEQSLYIQYACHANATKPVDYLAEQECYCGSTFWDADRACNACYNAHGLKVEPEKEYGDRISSFSSKVCASTPQAGGIAAAAKTDLPDNNTFALSYEKASAVAHPSQTAVSYYAEVKPMSIPTITGEAAARQTTWGNMDGKGALSGAGVNVAPIFGAILAAMALGAGLIL